MSLVPPGALREKSASRLAAVLKRGCGLLVSLPRNDEDLAKAAAAAGADALKVHINVHHEASGTTFGTLEQERKSLEAILKAVQPARPGPEAGSGLAPARPGPEAGSGLGPARPGPEAGSGLGPARPGPEAGSGLAPARPGIPVGIVTGAEQQPSREEADQLISMGFDFFDAFAHYMPAWMLRLERVGRVAAIDASYTWEQIDGLASAGAQALEAAVMQVEDYGRPLTASDIARYCALRRATSLPIIVPTQKKIEPEEAADLTHRLGIEAVMIGVIVAGDSPQSIEKATAAFARCMRQKAKAV